MGENRVWVSRAYMDSTLIKSFKFDLSDYPSPTEIQRVSGGRHASFPRALFIPEKMWLDPKKKLWSTPPPLFQCGAGLFVSSELKVLLERFELGKTTFHSMPLFKSNKTTPIDADYFLLNFGEVKHTLRADLSPKVKHNPYDPIPDRRDPDAIWSLPHQVEDDLVTVDAAALDRMDLWMEPQLRSTFFVSDGLYQALKEAKLHHKLKLFRCAIADESNAN